MVLLNPIYQKSRQSKNHDQGSAGLTGRLMLLQEGSIGFSAQRSVAVQFFLSILRQIKPISCSFSNHSSGKNYAESEQQGREIPFSLNVGPHPLLRASFPLMWSHWQLKWVEHHSYCQIMWAEIWLDCGSGRLSLRVTTTSSIIGQANKLPLTQNGSQIFLSVADKMKTLDQHHDISMKKGE
ncbi:hypothetical protein [Desulfogranum marinum]|uniref:hypothetical protein n=1 Tax=Desulfogranum marinum TaxID=453220 RepID=UPI001963FEDA|nr:hypothetical protein [Desulfogranum marinum]MBM9514020.1 hypothetical protein [Desulfogranum marinum]